MLSGALRRDPRNVAALVGAGTLAGLRHDFREQLRLGLEAKRVAPALARPYTVIADSQIELIREQGPLEALAVYHVGNEADARAMAERLSDLVPLLGTLAYIRCLKES